VTDTHTERVKLHDGGRLVIPFPIRFDPSNRVHQIYFKTYGWRPFSMCFFRCVFVRADS
jgi:hypothetical protein